MKTRSPRNKTLILTDDEKLRLGKKLRLLTSKTTSKDLVDSVFHQDMFDALDLLPDAFVDLLLVDPPYNLSKKYGESKFTKSSNSAYEEWFEKWIVKIKRCLKADATIYVCSDWQSSVPVQRVLERHFIIRNRITWEREKGEGLNPTGKTAQKTFGFALLVRSTPLMLMP